MIPILLLLACGPKNEQPSATEAAEPAPTEVAAEPDLTPPEGDACFDDCMRQNMARAVAAEVIERDCMNLCGSDLPKVREAADLGLKSGTRVVVRGTLRRAALPDDTQGTALELSDGTTVFLTYGDPPHGWDGLMDMMVDVKGEIWEAKPPTEHISEDKAQDVPHLVDVDAPIPVALKVPGRPPDLE